MSNITLKGTTYSIKDDIPGVDMPAPDITLVKENLEEVNLYDDFSDKVKVLIGVPSLDTGICRKEALTFNKLLGEREGVVGIVISKDLPMAMKRFCKTEGADNISYGSDFRYNDFINEYNTEILSGPMKGFSARAVFVLDGKNIIRYAELVPEILSEPDYDAVLKVVDSLL